MSTAVRAWRIPSGDAARDQRRVAGALRRRGVCAGERVVLCRPSSPALLAAVLGAARSGVVPVVLNPALLPHERDALVADADPALVVADDAALAELVDGPEADIADVPLVRPMHYTSGTTGRPKGVYSGVLDEGAARALFEDEADLWGVTAEDVHLVCSPLHHSAPLRFSTVTLLRGGTVVLLERFDAATAAAAFTEHGVRTTFVVPAHLQRLLALERPLEVSGVRLLAHAGAPCPAPLKRVVLDRFPTGTVWEFYGSTEGQFTVCSPEEWLERPGTVGRARPGRRLEVDAEERIWCSVPAYARFSYWRDPVKTGAAWRGDAFTVGDLGRLDGDGYLFIAGRREDLIISGGVNVYPAEVEDALADHPGVVEVAVFGAPDERWGQRVCAAVIGGVDPDALLQFARARLAPYKCPKSVYLVEDLPRTASGKVRRVALPEVLGLSPPQR